MTSNLTYRGTVYPWHCDHIGHMNVMWYVGKFDEATWNLFADAGLTSTYLGRNNRGMAAVEQHVKYVAELRAGDVVSINSTVLEVRPRVVRFTHEMINTGTNLTAASCTLTAVHLDTSTRAATVFDTCIRERLEAMM